MTRNYNRSFVYNFLELDADTQEQVKNDFSMEENDCENCLYVLSKFKGEETAIPLYMFMRTEGSNFTHGIFSDSAFSGYFVTFSRDNSEAVIAYKYF